AREALLADRLRSLRSVDADLADLHGGGALEVPAIREALPPGVQLLEYYISRGIIRACVVGRDRLDIQELGPAADVAAIVRLLRMSRRSRPTTRSEEHTSELQSRGQLVCRL